MQIKSFFKLSLFVLCLTLARNVVASQSIYFSLPSGTIAVGTEFPVKILVDSDQPLNAYAVAFSYSGESLTLLSFDNSRSIIDIWQGQPLASEAGGVTLHGGSLTAWSGNGGNIITVLFRAAKEGPVTMQFGNSSAYLANGKGTKIIPQSADLKFAIAAAGAASSSLPLYEEASEMTPPLIKYLSLIQDPFNSDQKLLSFMVSDPESGIKGTFVRTRSFLFWGDWKSAQNPTAIPLSVWAIGFRAVDNRSNVAEKTLYNPSAFLRPGALTVVIIFIISLFVIGLIIIKRKGRGIKQLTN